MRQPAGASSGEMLLSSCLTFHLGEVDGAAPHNMDNTENCIIAFRISRPRLYQSCSTSSSAVQGVTSHELRLILDALCGNVACAVVAALLLAARDREWITVY